MDELDQLAAFVQGDSQGRLARAAQFDQRLASAASIVEAYRWQEALDGIAPGRMPLGLTLPPELQGVGELAVLLAPPGAVTVGRTPARLGTEPRASLHIGERSIDLTPHVSAAAHPTQSLLVLLGLLTAARAADAARHVPELSVRETLARCHPTTPTGENPAKQIAQRLNDRIPCFWGTEIEAAAARDWAARRLWLSESMALATDQDGLSRLLVMARFPRFWPNAAAFVQLVTPGAPDKLAEQVDYLLSRRRFPMLTLRPPQTTSPLDRALYWLELGEWIALYAAMLNNVDPAARVPLDLLFGV